MAIEYVEYSIEEYLAKEKFTTKRLTKYEIFAQMLSALREFHELGKVHIDIKPENFRISSDHIVKLIDFGTSMDYITDG